MFDEMVFDPSLKPMKQALSVLKAGMLSLMFTVLVNKFQTIMRIIEHSRNWQLFVYIFECNYPTYNAVHELIPPPTPRGRRI